MWANTNSFANINNNNTAPFIAQLMTPTTYVYKAVCLAVV